ncbi:unnamed protein product [Amoebophrya sp. A120]|nr:unnamed protein product [Amoebophrya sp. A120]|eukprot:GSA120T00002430001.1
MTQQARAFCFVVAQVVPRNLVDAFTFVKVPGTASTHVHSVAVSKRGRASAAEQGQITGNDERSLAISVAQQQLREVETGICRPLSGADDKTKGECVDRLRSLLEGDPLRDSNGVPPAGLCALASKVPTSGNKGYGPGNKSTCLSTTLEGCCEWFPEPAPGESGGCATKVGAPADPSCSYVKTEYPCAKTYRTPRQCIGLDTHSQEAGACCAWDESIPADSCRAIAIPNHDQEEECMRNECVSETDAEVGFDESMAWYTKKMTPLADPASTDEATRVQTCCHKPENAAAYTCPTTTTTRKPNSAKERAPEKSVEDLLGLGGKHHPASPPPEEFLQSSDESTSSTTPKPKPTHGLCLTCTKSSGFEGGPGLLIAMELLATAAILGLTGTIVGLVVCCCLPFEGSGSGVSTVSSQRGGVSNINKSDAANRSAAINKSDAANRSAAGKKSVAEAGKKSVAEKSTKPSPPTEGKEDPVEAAAKDGDAAPAAAPAGGSKKSAGATKGEDKALARKKSAAASNTASAAAVAAGEASASSRDLPLPGPASSSRAPKVIGLGGTGGMKPEDYNAQLLAAQNRAQLRRQTSSAQAQAAAARGAAALEGKQ